MLRNPKDVAREVRQASMSGWETQTGEGVIRADRAAVIAEAKDVVRAFATVEQPTDKILAALDAILGGKE